MTANVPASRKKGIFSRSVLPLIRPSGQKSSRSSTSGSGTPVRFGNINPAYPNTFQTFTPQRLFTVLDSTELDVTFFVPSLPALGATVNGFGAVLRPADTLLTPVVPGQKSMVAPLSTAAASTRTTK